MKMRLFPILYIIILLVLSAGIVLALFFVRQDSGENSVVENANTIGNSGIVTNVNANTSNATTEIGTSDWMIYENEDYGFSFEYPTKWQFSEPNEFCFKADMQTGGTCVNLIAGLNPPTPSKSYLHIEHAGLNPDNLTVNEWRNQVEGKIGNLENIVYMGDFEGFSLEKISKEDYKIMVGIYFSAGDQIFTITWYDREYKDEHGYNTFIDILKGFKKI